MWAQKNKWKTYLQNHFHGKPLSIFARNSELFLLQNEFFSILILYVLDVHEEAS
jgi:hypothetical protein